MTVTCILQQSSIFHNSLLNYGNTYNAHEQIITTDMEQLQNFLTTSMCIMCGTCNTCIAYHPYYHVTHVLPVSSISNTCITIHSYYL